MAERKYTGILADRPTISVMDAADERQLSEYTQACLNRDEALFAEFSIDSHSDGAWQELAFALAERHVPAYGAKQRGRPSINSDENISILLRWQKVSRTNGCSDAEAIRIVAKEMILSETTVKERIKEIKRSEHMKVILTFMDGVEEKIGKEKIKYALDAIDETGDGLEDYIEVRKRKLSRPPYK